jgi:hypothetical protein
MPTLTIDGDYANYTAQQCFNPNFTFSQQVDCHSQHLNVTHPPSTWSYDEYPFLWEPTVCLLTNVTYSQRINVPDNFNWCFVPLSGSDAFLFVSLALIACGCLFGKLSAVWVLITGGVVGAINNWANLRHISNSITLWLGISPPDLFFYAFLPPLLVDSAIRIDFFMFSKLWVHCLLMAFVMVVLSALILTPRECARAVWVCCTLNAFECPLATRAGDAACTSCITPGMRSLCPHARLAHIWPSHPTPASPPLQSSCTCWGLPTVASPGCMARSLLP